jgi:hypothetical protein
MAGEVGEVPGVRGVGLIRFTARAEAERSPCTIAASAHHLFPWLDEERGG